MYLSAVGRWRNRAAIGCWVWLFAATLALFGCNEGGNSQEKDNDQLEALLLDEQPDLVLTLQAGELAKPTIIKAYRSGARTPARVDKLAFRSMNPEIAQVDANGQITALAVGATAINVTHMKSGVATHISVNVVEVPKAHIIGLTLSPSPLELFENTRGQMQVAAIWSDQRENPVAADLLEWVVGHGNLITVDSAGTVQAVLPGETTLTVKLKREPAVSATVAVSIKKDALQSLYIKPSESFIEKGEAVALKLYGKLSSGLERELLRGVSWQSQDPSIATINAQGILKGIDYGNATINASYQGYFGKGRTSTRFNVAKINQLDIYPLSYHLLPGKKERLTIRTIYEHGGVGFLSDHERQHVEWRSENNDIAYVDRQGVLHAKSDGHIKVTASYKNSKPISITVNVTGTAAERAYYSGAANDPLDGNEIYNALDNELSLHEKASPAIVSAKKAIYRNNELTQVSWQPNEESYIFRKSPFITNDMGVLVSADGESDLPLAHIGLTQHGKFAHFSHLPISKLNGASFNDNTAELFSRTLGWLLGDISGFKELNITISGGDEWWGIRDYDVLTGYLDSLGRAITYNAKNTCNDGTVLQCVKDKNSKLIVIFTTMKNQDDIDEIIRSGIPVLLVTSDRHLTASTQTIAGKFGLLPVKAIKGSGLNVVDYDPANRRTDNDMSHLAAFFGKLQRGDFNFDINSCSGQDCSDEGYMSEFYNDFALIRGYLTGYDVSNFNPFLDVHSGQRGFRILIALSDHLRHSVKFPVPPKEKHKILQTMVADGWTYNSRLINPRREDVGNFGPHLVDVSAEDTLINISSLHPYRGLGISAIPGHTFTITRKDNAKTDVSIIMNAFREGATKEFSDYNRPKYLTSPKYMIKPGETLTLTSSLGGSLYVAATEDDKALSLEVKGIAIHPTYKAGGDIAQFVTDYESKKFNWFDIIMPNTEWHVRKDRFEEILDDPKNIYYRNLDLFIEDTEKYLHGHPRALAAQTGPGIPAAMDEVTEFSRLLGVALRHTNSVQHFNNDQANCGDGCSGNPIDSGWTPDPLSHGHIHELGHNLERAFMLEPLNIGHAMTNWFVYYSQTQKNKSDRQDELMQPCGTDDYHDHYMHYLNFGNWLSEASQSASPHRYMNDKLNSNSNYQISEFVMTQLIMLAENQGGMKDGWNIIPRLYLHNDLYQQARRNSAKWNELSPRLGFDGIEFSQKITHNDYLVVAYSTVMRLNLADYFYMLGFEFNREMVGQALSSAGHQKPQALLYTAADTNLCLPPYLQRKGTAVEQRINVALNKPVTGTSVSWSMERAVDGDYYTHAETKPGSQQSITVDLKASNSLHSVRVVNFNDKRYAHRFKDTIIQLLNEDKDLLWQSPELEAVKFYQHNFDTPMEAVRYIRLYKEEGLVQTTQIEAFTARASLH